MNSLSRQLDCKVDLSSLSESECSNVRSKDECILQVDEPDFKANVKITDIFDDRVLIRLLIFQGCSSTCQRSYLKIFLKYGEELDLNEFSIPAIVAFSKTGHKDTVNSHVCKHTNLE